MRGIAYTIAVIAAIGIMYVIATRPPLEQPPANQPAVATASSSNVMSQSGTLTLSVPSMHCEFACYPRVKETLEAADGVTEVVLDEQQAEGVIDNRQVVVTYDAGFDLNAALASLSKEGFNQAAVVQ